MMIAFWLSSLSLFLISIIVIVKTILKKNDQKEQSQNSNISLYNQKILEIDKDIENKTITSEEAENIKKELDKSLSEHNEKSKVVASSFYHSSNASKTRVSIILILIIPVFASKSSPKSKSGYMEYLIFTISFGLIKPNLIFHSISNI